MTMALCPFCEEILDEYDPEWISEEEELYQAKCEKCGWRGTVTYIEEDDNEIIWDERTDTEIPSSRVELEAWREESAKYYNV